MLKRGIFNYQAFSRLSAKIALGIFVLSFFAFYQPLFPNSPSLNNPVLAQQPQQTQTITPAQTPITMQLPHPGYLSTSFSNYHPGIDIASGLGMPVKPIAKGVVVDAGFNFWGLGLVVEVEHTAGFRSLYAHLGKIYVQKGKEVDVGDLLGEVGLTGRTSGPHTHLELSKDGAKIDPIALLPELRSYPQEEDFLVYQSATPSAVLVPVATNSATLNVTSYQLTTPNPLHQTFTPEPLIEEEKRPSIDEVKEEQAKSSLNNILTITKSSPGQSKPPQGGGFKLLDLKLLSRPK